LKRANLHRNWLAIGKGRAANHRLIVRGITRFDKLRASSPRAHLVFLSSGLTTSARPQARALGKGARVGSATWNYTPTARVKGESVISRLKLRSATAWRPSMHNHRAWPSKARRYPAHKSLAVGNDDDLARRRIFEDWIVRPGKAIWRGFRLRISAGVIGRSSGGDAIVSIAVGVGRRGKLLIVLHRFILERLSLSLRRQLLPLLIG
jgi:hypothetical protein